MGELLLSAARPPADAGEPGFSLCLADRQSKCPFGARRRVGSTELLGARARG